MGKKKSNSQPRLQQSLGNLVSKAALAQLGPQIEDMVISHVQHLGQQISMQQASTLQTLFSRVVVLEQIVMDKLGLTSEDLTGMVADLEDSKEGLAKAESVESGDVVRLEISTKTKDQTEYQGSSRLKVSQIGSGQTLGNELEGATLGMKAGETKEINFGKDGGMVAKLTVDRVSRRIQTAPAPTGDADATQAQG